MEISELRIAVKSSLTSAELDDVGALVTEARQRVASQRAAIEAKRAFFLAQSDLQIAVNGGGAIGGGEVQSVTSAAAQATGNSH